MLFQEQLPEQRERKTAMDLETGFEPDGSGFGLTAAFRRIESFRGSIFPLMEGSKAHRELVENPRRDVALYFAEKFIAFNDYLEPNEKRSGRKERISIGRALSLYAAWTGIEPENTSQEGLALDFNPGKPQQLQWLMENIVARLNGMPLTSIPQEWRQLLCEQAYNANGEFPPMSRAPGFSPGGLKAHTLNRNRITSPSCTT